MTRERELQQAQSAADMRQVEELGRAIRALCAGYSEPIIAGALVYELVSVTCRKAPSVERAKLLLRHLYQLETVQVDCYGVGKEHP